MTATATTPPLEAGDRLSREEFHRRYAASPHIRKAELVEGVVVVPFAVGVPFHAEPHSLIIIWLGTYLARQTGVHISDNGTVLLDGHNEVQPDACLFRDPPLPGRATLNQDGYLVGPPDFVVEIASSSASYDLHDKKRAYERNGVPEYVVWRTRDQALDWFRLVDGAYQLVTPDDHGIIESHEFLGLRLFVPALLSREIAAVLRALDEPSDHAR